MKIQNPIDTAADGRTDNRYQLLQKSVEAVDTQKEPAAITVGLQQFNQSNRTDC